MHAQAVDDRVSELEGTLGVGARGCPAPTFCKFTHSKPCFPTECAPMPVIHVLSVLLLGGALLQVQGQRQESGWQQQQQQLSAIVRHAQRYTAVSDGAAVSAGWHNTPTPADATALGSDLPRQQSRPHNDGHSSEHLSNGVMPARRLSATSQAPVTAAGAGAQTLALDIPTRQGCPSSAMMLTAPGCTCTVYRTENGRGQDSAASSRSSRSAIRSNVCPSGYRCSPSAAVAIFAAGWSRNSSSGAPPDVDGFTTERGICIPCQLGERISISSSRSTTTSHLHLGRSHPPACLAPPAHATVARQGVPCACLRPCRYP